jgi:hypothetical protein
MRCDEHGRLRVRKRTSAGATTLADLLDNCEYSMVCWLGDPGPTGKETPVTRLLLSSLVVGGIVCTAPAPAQTDSGPTAFDAKPPPASLTVHDELGLQRIAITCVSTTKAPGAVGGWRPPHSDSATRLNCKMAVRSFGPDRHGVCTWAATSYSDLAFYSVGIPPRAAWTNLDASFSKFEVLEMLNEPTLGWTLVKVQGGTDPTAIAKGFGPKSVVYAERLPVSTRRRAEVLRGLCRAR